MEGTKGMSVIAEFTIPTEEFALSAAFDAIPNMAVEIERMVAHPASRVLPYLWVCGGTASAVRRNSVPTRRRWR